MSCQRVKCEIYVHLERTIFTYMYIYIHIFIHTIYIKCLPRSPCTFYIINSEFFFFFKYGIPKTTTVCHGSHTATVCKLYENPWAYFVFRFLIFFCISSCFYQFSPSQHDSVTLCRKIYHSCATHVCGRNYNFSTSEEKLITLNDNRVLTYMT